MRHDNTINSTKKENRMVYRIRAAKVKLYAVPTDRIKCEDKSLLKDLKRTCTEQWQQKPSQRNIDCLRKKILGLSVQILKYMCEVRVGVIEKCEGRRSWVDNH
jgi:hypothetical protein